MATAEEIRRMRDIDDLRKMRAQDTSILKRISDMVSQAPLPMVAALPFGGPNATAAGRQVAADIGVGVGNMITNEIPNAVGGAINLGSRAISEPGQLARDAYQTGRNIVSAVRQNPVGVAGAVVEGMVPTREKIRTELGGMALDVTGFLGGPAGLVRKGIGATGTLPKVVKTIDSIEEAIQAFNPISQSVRLADYTARKLGRGSVNAVEIATGILSGKGREPYRQVREKGLDEAIGLVDVAQRWANTIVDERNMRDMRWREAAAQLANSINPNDPIDPAAVIMDAAKQLRRDNIAWKKVIRADGTEEFMLDHARRKNKDASAFSSNTGPNKEARQLLDDAQTTLLSWDRNALNPVDEAHRVKDDIDDLIAKAVSNENKRAARILLGIKESVVKEIESKVPGYVQRNMDYRKASQGIELLEDELGLSKKVKRGGGAVRDVGADGESLLVLRPETVRRFNNLMRDIDSSQIQRSVIAEMNKRLSQRMGKPVDLIGELASGVLNTDTPNGVITQLFGLVPATGGAFMAGGPAGAAATLASFFTLRNPRMMGRFFDTIGRLERDLPIEARGNITKFAAGIQKVAQFVANNTDKRAIAEGITFGVALNRLAKQPGMQQQMQALMAGGSIPPVKSNALGFIFPVK